jgi:hypothetical protein
MPLIGRMNLVNIVMLFLLMVVLLTVKMGRTAGVTVAFVSAALFDVLFVEPRFSFSVTDAQWRGQPFQLTAQSRGRAGDANRFVISHDAGLKFVKIPVITLRVMFLT